MLELLQAPELKPVSISAILKSETGEFIGHTLSVVDKTGTMRSAILSMDSDFQQAIGMKSLNNLKPGRAIAGDYDQLNYSLAEFLRINSDTEPEIIKQIESGFIDQYFNSIGYMFADIT